MKNNERTIGKKTTKHALKWLLEVGWHNATMTEHAAREISRVSNQTFDRWLNGETTPPAATLELLRLHAYGEPPNGFSKAWAGFKFQNDLLTTPDGRNLKPGDLMAVFIFRQAAFEYWHLKRQEQPGFDPYEQLRNAMAA